MAMRRDRLYIGIAGRVVAIDPATGEEIWRTTLKTASVATVAVVSGALYGAAGGELFRLDPTTGDILWRNKLRGLGLGVVTFPGSDAAAAGEVERRRQESASAG